MIQSIDEILNFQVPLVEAPDLSKAYGAKISFLDGSVYPVSGTVKDLRNAQILLDDRDQDEVVYADISWGNSARSMAALAKLEEKTTGKRRIVIAIIPKGYLGLKDDLEREGCIVIERGIRDLERKISDEELKKIVLRKLKQEGVNWSGNPSSISKVERENHYGAGYKFLSNQIPDRTDYVFVPFGSGEIALGIFNGLLSKYLNDLGKMPTVVCVESRGKSRLRGKNLTHDKTLTRFSTFRTNMENLSRKYAGKIEFMTVSDLERDREYGLLQLLGINAEPSAALASAGTRKYEFPSNDNGVTILNTGFGRIYQRKRTIYKAICNQGFAKVAAALLISAGIGAIFSYSGLKEYQKIQAFNKMYRDVFAQALEYAPRVGDKVKIDDYLVDPHTVLSHGKKPIPFWDLKYYKESEQYAHGGDGEIFRAMSMINVRRAGMIHD